MATTKVTDWPTPILISEWRQDDRQKFYLVFGVLVDGVAGAYCEPFWYIAEVNGGKWSLPCGRMLCDVTHWMALPPDPE